MAEAGPQAPDIPAPLVPQVPQQPTQQAQQIVHLNWAYFKPEFSGKPEEHPEVHLLRTNDWMNTNHSQEAIKVQRFCLILVGEARLWYESLESITEIVQATVLKNRCNKYNSEFASGTLGIQPDTYVVPVSYG